MKKTFKKITAMLLTALFMVNLLPTGASAANPVESGIEPRDSGYFIYQYYDDENSVPGTWDESKWSIVKEDAFSVWLSNKIKDATVSQLKSKLADESELFSGEFGEELAEWAIERAGDLGSNITGFNFSVFYRINYTHEPFMYLTDYYIIIQPLGEWRTFEVATLI